MKKSSVKVSSLVNYEKLSGIELLKLPKVEKKNVPDYINCPKYEKAQSKLNTKMERHTSKVDRCIEALSDSHDTIEMMKKKRSDLDPGSGFWVNKEDPQAVARYNDRLDQMRKMTDKIEYAIEKHNDLVDKRTEAEEEAREALEELTLEALSAIDEDIPAVINRLEGIASNFSNSEDAEDLLAAIDVCLLGLRIFAMFDDLIDDRNSRSDAKEGVEKINKVFSSLCADDSVQNYMVDIYKRNLDLVQKNAGICQQIEGTLSSVDQKQLDTLSRNINVVLAERFDTTFNYSNVIDPAEIDKIVNKINNTIDSLKQNIEKSKSFQETETPAVELGKAGTKADQQAKSLKASMQTNVDALDGPLTQKHFAVQLIDEAVIDDFYQKDLRVATAALRKHIIDTIGEQNFETVLQGGDDRFSLKKAQAAIDKSNLSRLQSTLDKIPGHIRELSEYISSAESDIQKANEVPKRNADALRNELNGKYNAFCVPIIGFFTAFGISGRIKTFEAAFSGSNQIYKDLGNELLEKNKKMNIVSMIINLILGLGSLIFFLVSGGTVVISGIVLGCWFISMLVVLSAGKKLESYLAHSKRE